MPSLCDVSPTPVPGLYAVHAESAHRFTRHWHGTFGIGLIDAGAQRSLSGCGEVDACAGQVITHNPGEVHDGRPIGPAPRRWRMLHVEPAAMARLLGLDRADALEWTAPVLDDQRLAAALRTVFAILESRARAHDGSAAGSAARFEEAVLLAIGRIVPAVGAPEGERDTRRLDAVMTRLLDTADVLPTLDELAQLAQLSRYELVRQFGRRHGLPPMAWLQQLRLERARAQIARGTSLVQAATHGGFSDQSHLTRQFVRKFGYTPGAWRRATGAERAARGAISF